MKIKTLMNKARHTALVAAAALTALMPAACTSQTDEALTQQGPDTHKRMGAPTLGAFPTFDQRGTESRAVPGGFSDNTYNTPAQQKSSWEVGDSVLVEYDFTTYQKYNEGTDDITHYTELFTTYTVVAVAADGTPTLAISGGAWMRKYKYDGNSSPIIYDCSLTAIPAAEMAAGVPVPETVASDTYDAYAYYAPGSAWTAMDSRSNELIPASDLPGWNSSKKLIMWPRAITAANVGKGCMAATYVSDVAIGTAPTFTDSWDLSGSRLRIHALPGDEVTLSGDFYPTNSIGSLSDTPRPKHWADAGGTALVEAPSSVTATADANGNAWFYGSWNSGATLKVTLKSKTLTEDKPKEVFQTTATTASKDGKTYAIDAIATQGVFLGTSAELFAMNSDGGFEKKQLCNSAQMATKWMVTDAGTLNVDNDIKTALGLVADGRGIDLVLPNVTGIANGSDSNPSAFINCKALHSVSLPKAKTIGTGAFYLCKALTTVDAPVATTIWNAAFRDCTALTDVDVSAANNIGNSAFEGCTNLTTIDASAATTIGNSAFNACTNLTTIDASAATTIGSYAFNGTALTKVTVTKFTGIFDGSNALSGDVNAKLTDVTLTEETALPDNAFTQLKAKSTLKKFSAPKVQSIGNCAFYSCEALTTVYAPAANAIVYAAFYGCGSLKDITLGTVTSAGEYIFYYINNLATQTTLSIGKGTTAGSISGNTWTINDQTWTFQSITLRE